MKRIKDYYNWKTLEQWKYVIDNKSVGKKSMPGHELSEEELGQVVEFLIQDCIPISIFCSVKEDEKKIWSTPLWEKVFDFLDNKEMIRKDKRRMYFEDFSADEKKKIMRAQIYSIWIEEEADEDYVKLLPYLVSIENFKML